MENPIVKAARFFLKAWGLIREYEEKENGQ